MKSVRTSQKMAEDISLPFRDGQRRPVRWAARIWDGDVQIPCTIVNLSLGGAQIQLDAPLDCGANVRLDIPELCSFEGQTAWHKDGRIGIQFTTNPAKVRSSLGVMAKAFDPDLHDDED